MAVLCCMATSAFLIGCSSSASQRSDAPSQVVHTEPHALTVVPASTDSSFRLVLSPDAAKALIDASTTDVLVYGADTGVIRLPITKTTMGAPGRSETLTASAYADIAASVFRRASSFRILATIGDREHLYSVITNVDTAALALMPEISQGSDSGYVFTLRATRRRVVEGEYFPSSEQLRISVVNAKGATVWSSDHGMAYLTVIMPVEPEQKGSSHVYQQEWNGITLDGEPLRPGRYRVTFLLPVRRASYSTTLDITIPLK
ncbi:MAG: hypothetical protein FGM33_00180 [Candidatus Kapabacteria bacterium]|nr:hypothetical protein [Candidatus Kapabacteria bacterium]